MAFMTSAFTTLRESMSPLRHPNFRTYLGGQAISLIGTWLQSTAQAWVVWKLTGSEAALGVVSMFNTLPVLFLSAYAGVWADRIDRRKLLIGTQTAAMLLAFILAALTQTELVQLWHVYALSFILGVVTALDMPAQQAFLGDLSGLGEVRKAINLNIMILQVSRVLGPSLAGMIVGRLGIAPAFWLNGLSFMAVIYTLFVVRSSQSASRTAVNGAGPLAQIVEGLQYVRTQPRMQDFFLFAVLLTFFVFSIIMNVLPAIASKLLNGDAETLGTLMSSSGAGALIAVLFVVPLTQARKRVGLMMTLACFWLAAWLSVFAQSRSLPLSMVALFFGSMGAPTVMTMAMGLIQAMSPTEMRGRTAALFTTISFGMQPLAALFIGQMAERLGVAEAIQINAVLLVVLTAGLIVTRPALLRWEYNAPAASPALTDEARQAELPGTIEALPVGD